MELAEKVLEGDIRAAAKLARDVEDEVPGALEKLDSLYPHTGRAHIVGLTGAPGVGKSTLIDVLISSLRKKDLSVGVIGIDPTSPFTGGAILGDRIRMQKSSADAGVFIRSVATRGWRGGLAKATSSTIHIMDAMGKDIVLVETVGSGQSEVDIAKVTDTCILVMSPGTGDDVQMMKAGILEASDIFVVNKADKGGAGDVVLSIELMLGMRSYRRDEWKPSIILAQATLGKGAEELANVILRHKEFLVSSGELERRRKAKAKEELIVAAENFIRRYCLASIEESGQQEELVGSIAQRKISPNSAALEIIERLSKQLER